MSACSGSGGTTPIVDASDVLKFPDAGTASATDAQAGDETGSDSGMPLDASSLEAATESSPEAASEAGSCAPCGSAQASCIDVGPAIVNAYTMSQSPDGTCMIGGMTLECGGTGTAANGSSLSWSVAAGSPTIVIQAGTLLLNCRACPAGESTSTCNSHWATGGSTSLCQGAVGDACGSQFGGSADTLYQCSTSGTVIGSVVCAMGCQVAPSGTQDYCIGSDPCVSNVSPSGQNVLACGANLSPNADPNVLYSCNGQSTASTTVCSNGCFAAPPGQADHCQ